jgi:membrane-associated phospholipid phosphatase
VTRFGGGLLCVALGVALAGRALAAPAAGAAIPPAAGPAAPASQPAPPARLAPRLVVDFRWDLPVTLVLGLTYVTTEALGGRIAPSSCRWCDGDLNGLDTAGRRLRWERRGAADTTSDVLAYGLAPAVNLGLVSFAAVRTGGWRQAAVDDLIILQAVAGSAVLVQGVKLAAARQRPYVRDLALGAPRSNEDNVSFPSAHTALAFSLAVASGTVATLRGYRLAPWIWGAGLALATVTGYLRMAADQHYASDVIVGALTGSLVGWLVPYLLHRRVRR